MKRRCEDASASAPTRRPDISSRRAGNPTSRPDAGSDRRDSLPPSVSPTAVTSSWVGTHFGPVSAAALGLPAETEISIVTDPDRREELNRLFDEEIQAKRARRDDDADEEGFGINYRPDVGLDDRDLALITTKKLNKLLKDKKISKDRGSEIKQERRTLKNRGYAANCRTKRIGEETTLDRECRELDREHERRLRERKQLRALIEEQDRLLAVESSDEEED